MKKLFIILFTLLTYLSQGQLMENISSLSYLTLKNAEEIQINKDLTMMLYSFYQGEENEKKITTAIAYNDTIVDIMYLVETELLNTFISTLNEEGFVRMKDEIVNDGAIDKRFTWIDYANHIRYVISVAYGNDYFVFEKTVIY